MFKICSTEPCLNSKLETITRTIDYVEYDESLKNADTRKYNDKEASVIRPSPPSFE